MFKKFMAVMAGIFLFVNATTATMTSAFFTWENPTHNVDGSVIDKNGDGDLSEGLSGYKLYKVGSRGDGTRVDQLADLAGWDTLQFRGEWDYLPGEHCFAVTAYYEPRGGDIQESDNSGIVCKNWEDMTPTAPLNVLLAWLGLIDNSDA